MIDQTVARRVGAVALFVLGAAIAFVVFLFDRIEWGSHVRIRVFFHQTGGLHEGAPFVVGGASVGKIESIALSPRGAPGPLKGDEGVVATVAIDARAAREISRGGDIFVASHGLLSDRYLELAAPPTPGTRFREDDAVVGKDPPSMDRVLQRTWDNLQTAAKFFADVRPELAALKRSTGELSATIATLLPDLPGIAVLAHDVGELRSEALKTWEVGLGGQPGLDRAVALVAHVQRTARALRGQLAQLAERVDGLQRALVLAKPRAGAGGDQVLARLELAIERGKAVIAKLDPLLAQVDALDEQFARGEGSLGKLMHDPEFPEDAKELGKILKRQPWKVIGRPHD